MPCGLCIKIKELPRRLLMKFVTLMHSKLQCIAFDIFTVSGLFSRYKKATDYRFKNELI